MAVAAAMTGLLAVAHPVAATAATPDATKTSTSSDWLDVTWSGGDDSTVVKTAGVPGGGTTVSFLQKPSGQDEEVEPRELTLSVDGDAIAAETAALEDGSMVPAADSDLGAKQSEGTTTLTVEATDEAQTLIFLPEDAPKAADPDDQDDVDGWWSKLVGWITGDDDDSDDTAAQEDTATSSATSTRSPSPSLTSAPSGTSTRTPSSTPSSTSTGGDVCVVTQGQDQQGTVEANEGGQDEDYGVSDGPTAAPTFSEETRKKAAAAASDCGEGDGVDTGQDQDSDGLVTDDSPPAAEGVTRAEVAAGDWLSGASGDPAGIATLRGAPAEVATTWANGGSNGIAVPQLQSGGEYAADKWNKSLIVSVSPFEDGGSWAQAAAGDYDDQWTQQLNNLKNGWGDRDGTLFLSLAWELNGNWFAWSVTAGETDDFRAAWARYRALQKEILPEALLTLTMNRESNGFDGNSSDLIVKGDIDAYGADYYNHFPYAATQTEFEAALDERDGGGGPKGLNAHREVAEEAGVPLVLPEWNGSAKNGDSPGFIHFFAEHAGPGAGQVLAESLFEIDKDENNWALLGGTRMPKSAAVYAEEFSDTGGDSSDADATPAPSSSSSSSPTSSPTAATTASSTAGAVRIETLGDSIIDNDLGGARTALDAAFADAGVAVQWVGTSNASGPDTLSSRATDAHTGQSIEDMLPATAGWVKKADPDVVMVSAGGNDVMHGQGEGLEDRWAEYLTTICRAAGSGTPIVAATNHQLNTKTQAQNNALIEAKLNPVIEASDGSTAEGGCPVTVVDMDGVITDGLLADDLHPNARGYEAMAKTWLPALQDAIAAVA